MQNNDKKYFIPVDGTPIEVSEDVYRAYYQPIWNARYHAQKNGECRCTKAQLWKCDGVCPGCPFYAAGKKVSIDTPIGGEEDELTLGDTLADDAPSAESILMDKELLDTLYDELNRLDPDGRRICELIMQGKTERGIAADMGKRQSTINYQKNKVFSILRESLKDFIYYPTKAAVEAILRRPKIFSYFFIQNTGCPPAGTEDSKTTHVLRKEKNEMSKMREMEATIRELRDIASSINDILVGLITKPQGKPKLVPDSDKRPAMTTIIDDFKEDN